MTAGPVLSPVAITGGYPLAHRRNDAPPVTTALAALIYGLSNGQQHGFGATASLTALIAAVLLMIAFILPNGARAPPCCRWPFSPPGRHRHRPCLAASGALRDEHDGQDEPDRVEHD